MSVLPRHPLAYAAMSRRLAHDQDCALQSRCAIVSLRHRHPAGWFGSGRQRYVRLREQLGRIEEERKAEYFNNTRERLAAVAKAVGWPDPNELPQEEKDEINRLTTELDREIDLRPVVHAWRTSYHGGSQLEFWCKRCRDVHTHGRHSGPGTYIDPKDNVVPLRPGTEKIAGYQRLWRRYAERFEK